MRAKSSIFVLSTLFLTVISCNTEQAKAPVATANLVVTEVVSENIEDAGKTVASLNIEGMTCAMGCAKRIESKLSEMEGVTTASVDFENKKANIEYAENKVSEQDLIQFISELGDYKVTDGEVVKTVKEKSKQSTSKKEEPKTDISSESTSSLEAKETGHSHISFPNIFDVFTRLYKI